MGFLDIFNLSFGKKEEPKAFNIERGGSYFNYQSFSFNGEKNLGEVGPVRHYTLDYFTLRTRSWQALVESEIVQTIIYKYAAWVVGSGLKLTSEPATDLLKDEGVTIDKLTFSKQVEQRFNLYRESSESDFSNMSNLDAIAQRAYLNAKVGGDVLVILRFDGKNVTTQLVDGAHVQSPQFGTECFPQKLENGNEIIDGIEYDKTKKHVRYYVRKKDGGFTIVEAWGKKTGLQMAFMVKGLEYRLDNLRGMSLLSVVLERIQQINRYGSAALSSAEERSKVPYTIEHLKNSTGENPLASRMARVMANGPQDDVPKTVEGDDLAKSVAASTNKTVFNMPIDSKLVALDSKNELYFKDFYTTHLTAVCAAINMPYQVALSIYEGNFSASRAALKDWENTLKIERKKFADAFYKPIYFFWLEIQIMQGKIHAPGYLSAKIKGNTDVINAFRKCRFSGASVPHIDPLKEVEAIRLALGDAGSSMPLITLEEATELLYSSESQDNVVQFAKELDQVKKLNIESPVKTTLVKTN